MGRFKCWVIPNIPTVLIGLKDIATFRLESVILVLGKRLLEKSNAKIFEELPGFNCFPTSISTETPHGDIPHDDPDIEAILRGFEGVFADKLDGGRPNALPPLHL